MDDARGDGGDRSFAGAAPPVKGEGTVAALAADVRCYVVDVSAAAAHHASAEWKARWTGLKPTLPPLSTFVPQQQQQPSWQWNSNYHSYCLAVACGRFRSKKRATPHCVLCGAHEAAYWSKVIRSVQVEYLSRIEVQEGGQQRDRDR